MSLRVRRTPVRKGYETVGCQGVLQGEVETTFSAGLPSKTVKRCPDWNRECAVLGIKSLIVAKAIAGASAVLASTPTRSGVEAAREVVTLNVVE